MTTLTAIKSEVSAKGPLSVHCDLLASEQLSVLQPRYRNSRAEIFFTNTFHGWFTSPEAVPDPTRSKQNPLKSRRRLAVYFTARFHQLAAKARLLLRVHTAATGRNTFFHSQHFDFSFPHVFNDFQT